MIIRIDRVITAIAGIGLLAACAITQPPELPPDNPANPHSAESNRPAAFLTTDATTQAITIRLRQAPAVAETRGGEMPGMQHDAHAQMPEQAASPMKHETPPESANKVLGDEMKKTSDEMKKTSEALKKAEAPTSGAYYTCPMHPQIHEAQPGKCPI